ncbi:hypothetical protein PAMP_009619 [Pampus punctatissimus]
METTDPIRSPQCLPVGTEMDLDLVTDNTETKHGSPSVSSGDTKVVSLAPVVITRYYSVDDEGVDDVFIPPAPLPPGPSYMAAFLPAGGSTCATESNSSVTLANGAADDTEAKANPNGLDWYHGEKQLMAMAAQNKVDEEIIGTTQTSKESMDTVSLSSDSTPPTDQDQTSMEGVGSPMDPSGRNHRDNTTAENESNGVYEDIGNQTGKKELAKSQGDSEDKLMAENVDFKCNQNKTGAATNQTQVPIEVTNDDEEHVDTRSLNFNLTKCNWLRRESGISETQVPQLPITEGMSTEYVTETLIPEIMRKEQQGNESWKIASEIQQGEQLLQRLQLVQQRQDVDMSESPSTSQQAVQERRGEEKGVLETEVDDLRERRGDLTGEDEKHEEAKTNLMEKEKNKRNESEDVETKARTSPSMIPTQPEDQPETDKSDEVRTHETSFTQIPFLSIHQQFSDAETPEAEQGKQDLQRARGVFNLADDPDVLEIPFRTNISLEPLSSKVSPGLHRHWQFSEHKMQKETQGEHVLVNQGKMSGGYSKSEVRQLQDTKLLFEAFQQENTEGPTRYIKPATSLMKGHICPTALERTRSLEALSLKSCPIFRTLSLRVYKSSTPEKEKSPENVRSKSQTEGSQDKTHLSSYPKQDKHMRLYRSMDSINTDDSTSAGENRLLTREGNRTQESPILMQNPFFKLRPALALQPEVEKDIREAREREEELRRQRCTLYGENRQNPEEEEKSPFTQTLIPGSKQQSRGKLERVWPPPSKTDQIKSEQTQREPNVHRAGGQKAPLWQRWESGLINGKPSKEKN